MPFEVSGLRELTAYLSKVPDAQYTFRRNRLVLVDLTFDFDQETADRLLFDQESRIVYRAWNDEQKRLEQDLAKSLPPVEETDRILNAAEKLIPPDPAPSYVDKLNQILVFDIQTLTDAMVEYTEYMDSLIANWADIKSLSQTDMAGLTKRASEGDPNIYRAYIVTAMDPKDVYSASVFMEHQIQQAAHRQLLSNNVAQQHGWYGSAMLCKSVRPADLPVPALMGMSDKFTACRFMAMCRPDALGWTTVDDRREKQLAAWHGVFDRLERAMTETDDLFGDAKLAPGDIVTFPLALKRKIGDEDYDLPVTVEPELASRARALADQGLVLVFSAGNTGPRLCRQDFTTTCGLDLKQWAFNVDGVSSGIILAADHQGQLDNTRCIDATIPFRVDAMDWLAGPAERFEMEKWLMGASSSCVFVAAALGAITNIYRLKHPDDAPPLRPQGLRAMIRQYQLDLLSDDPLPDFWPDDWDFDKLCALPPDDIRILFTTLRDRHELAHIRFCDYLALCVGNGWLDVVRNDSDTPMEQKFYENDLIQEGGKMGEDAYNAYYEKIKKEAYLCR